MLKVIKRDKRVKNFSFDRIKDAIHKAYLDSSDEATFKQDYPFIESMIEKRIDLIASTDSIIHIEQIQDIVIYCINMVNPTVGKAYSDYRDKRNKARKHPIDSTILNLINGKDEFLAKENANKNSKLVSTQRDLMAGTISRYLADGMIPEEFVMAEQEGIFKLHDRDYIVNPMSNCELVPLNDLFEKGTVINGKMIETPKSLQTAMTLATQIITQVTSFTYGGCSISLTHLAPFVKVSYEKFKKLIRQEGLKAGIEYTKDQINAIAKERVKKEIKDGVQTFNYQISTMNSTNGQSPFVTIFIYLSEDNGKYKKEIAMLAKEFFKQRIEGMKNGHGVKTTQTFPKILFTLDEDNIHPYSEYHWLLQLAMKCTAKRMAPDYISAKNMKKVYGDVFPCMGCRSFLFPHKDENGNYKWYGRCNLGVCTISLVDIALTSQGDEKKFWELLDYRMEHFIKPMGEFRYNKLKGVTSDVAPLLWQHGVFGRLKPGQPITDCLDKMGFSISIGYNGIYEVVKYMKGVSHTTPEGFEFAKKILQFLSDKADQWKEETGLGFSVYGTPAEESTDWFAKKLVAKFGMIPDITDKGYITNSYHVDVREPIDAFTKLKIEGELQKYSKGGCVSYVETNNMENNIPALYEIVKCIYENNTHAEINTESDYCYKCGYSGPFKNSDSEDLHWYCPNCGNEDPNEMSVVRRVCGYLSDKGIFILGRMKDIVNRIKHL